MRLATITNWAYGTTVALTLISGGAMLLANNAHEQERTAVAQRFVLDRTTDSVANDLLALTNHARQFVSTGDLSYETLYRRELRLLHSAERRDKRLAAADFSRDEQSALADAIRWADSLEDEQVAALDAFRKGDVEGARGLLFGPEYERRLAFAEGDLKRFRDMVDSRTASAVRDATTTARALSTIAQISLAITGLTFLCVLFFVFKRRVLRRVVKLSDVVNRLAAQDYAVDPPEIGDIDEIGDIAQAVRLFREAGLERQRLEAERAADGARRDMLSRMTQRLQGCDGMADLKEVVAGFMPGVAPGYAGRLYVLDGKRNAMHAACEWSEPTNAGGEFPPLKCWAVRRGAAHRFNGSNIDVPCEHLTHGVARAETLCLPLTAQRETVGLLYLERTRASAEAGETADSYLAIVAENIGLALANLQLRDALKDLALVDPLTGLANRRGLDAVLDARVEAARAEAKPLAALMIDIDHFKRFNDTFGHDAGDAVLRAVGEALQGVKREHDEAFRLGGEEFLLLMPGMGAEQAAARAEHVRRRIGELAVRFEQRDLGPVTASIGVAVAAEGRAHARLVQDADAALLRAKQGGRDRVVFAEQRAA